MELLLEPSRVIYQIDLVLNAFVTLFQNIFAFSDAGFLKMLVSTILNSDLLLVGVVLLIIGFAVGLLSRMIRT